MDATLQSVQLEEILLQAERIIRLGLTILFAYLVALWLAAIFWTFQDIRSRSSSAALQFFATLLVIVFNFPGLLVYIIMRPQKTLAELYAESLEEEALLNSLNDLGLCPSCRQPIEAEFLFCPWCQTRLRQRCLRCERPILITWKLCPYCGADRVTVSPTAPVSQEMVKP
jgi:hypothetical protein